MTMRHRVRSVVIFWSALVGLSAAGQSPRDAVPVEPAELERRVDLIGREVVVDDHVRYYVTRDGGQPDELQLKRTPVTFQVPRQLRPSTTQRLNSVIVRGVLRRDEGTVVCAVTDIKPVTADLDRLERGIASLQAKDFETRKAWARWAERRAKEFKDAALLEKAKTIEGEALRIESEMTRLGVDAPREWLALAQEARRRKVAEPEPSALAHRALRAKLAAAPTALDVRRVIDEIKAFFPEVAADLASARVNVSKWIAAYADNPAATYRDLPAPLRKAFDRRLWADATERLFELDDLKDLPSALTLADQAASVLPERPELPRRLVEKATTLTRKDLGMLRQSEVKALAATYRDRLQQPDVASQVLTDWLKVQRDRLSSTDAEGMLELAVLHEELAQDRVTAIDLLRKAWRIDPASKEIAEAFRTRGFRKANDDWIEGPGGARADSVGASSTGSVVSKGLRGLTADEVRTRLGGKPDRVTYVGSKGQFIEQWIYHLDTKHVRFVNLLRSPGELKPRVIADYTVPVARLKGGSGKAR